MLKKTFTLSLFATMMAMTVQMTAQNLVPNPSFETYYNLPCTWSPDLPSTIEAWTSPNSGSPDVFSTLVNQSCYAHCQSTSTDAAGSQLPRTGDITSAILTYGAGCGFQPDYREYLQVPLTSPLVVGETYYAEMYVSHTDYSVEASNNIGFYFSETAVSVGNCFVLDYEPQINETEIITEDVEWVKISGTFVADSPAQYLTIGNFYDNDNTDFVIANPNTNINARYYVDDVYVGLSTPEPCTATYISQTICEGSSVTLIAEGDSTNSWAVSTMPDSIISNADSLMVMPGETSTYIQYSGCDTVFHTIDLLAAPIAGINGDLDICLGESTELTATGGLNYAWSNGAIDPTILVSPITNTSYMVTVVDGMGCTSETAVEVLVQEVDNGVTLTDDVLMATATDATYQWVDCENNFEPIPNETAATFEPTMSGNYAVVVTQNGCTEMSDCVPVMVLSANGPEGAERPLIFPNPTTSQLNISLANPAMLDIQLMDYTGKTILQQQLQSNTTIDLSVYPSGVYFLLMRSDSWTWTERVIKI